MDLEVDAGLLGGQPVEALSVHLERLQRAVDASDVDQIIGTSKELVECACKVVLDGLGASYGSGVDMPALSRQTLEALGSYPEGLQDRDPLRALTGALSQIPIRIAELRNTDGTGHGRSALSDVFLDNAYLIGEVATAWARWCVKALERILTGFRELAEVEEGILGGSTFRRGELEELLRSLEIEKLQPEFQHRLGLATGRRAASGTFNVASDVLEPVAEGKTEYPDEFLKGIVEGLFLDSNGYLRCLAWSLRGLAKTVDQFPAADDLLSSLGGKIDEAEVSYAVKDGQLDSAVAELRRQALQVGSPELRRRLADLAKAVSAHIK